jgi:comEA protein
MNEHQTRRVSCLALVLVFVLVAAAHSAAQQKKQPPSAPIDLNTATPEQLQQVPGIGPSTAKSIVNFRQKSGPFQRVEDLLAIKGISKSRLEKMRPYVTVTPPPKKAAIICDAQPGTHS